MLSLRLSYVNHARSMRRNRTYSLEAEVDIETADFSEPIDDPQMYLEWKEKMCTLCHALNSLTDQQGTRIEAYYILGRSQTQIAEKEGVSIVAVCRSIDRGLKTMKKIIKNADYPVKKCPQSVP